MASRSTSAAELMDGFATAVDDPDRRYLWTDAFAVCNWIGLGRVDQARALADRVHHVLGRHRPDDPRTGWISGLPDDEAGLHPTRGGLRIGKPLPERAPDEPYDPRLEWERDGQYFHYLTRWMRALHRLSDVTGAGRYREWAVELARVSFDAFSHGIGPVPNRLHWKMSIDLSRPQVPSMGQHDPLDGFIVMSALADAAGGAEEAGLRPALDALLGMGEGSDWATEDPLGAGALLADAWFLSRLEPHPERTRVLRNVLDAAQRSLLDLRDTRLLDLPPARRLAFRELGLAIGLAAVEALARRPLPADLAAAVEPLAEAASLRSGILAVWTDPVHRRSELWEEHRDINTVMLATALDPGGYLGAIG